MAAPIREVLWIFPGVIAPSSSTLCCITLMILIRRNTISSEPSSSAAAHPPLRPSLWPRVLYMYMYGSVHVCVCVISRTRTHKNANERASAWFFRSFHVPSLNSRNEAFLINIGPRLFFADLSLPSPLPPSLSFALQQPLIYTLMPRLIFHDTA